MGKLQRSQVGEDNQDTIVDVISALVNQYQPLAMIVVYTGWRGWGYLDSHMPPTTHSKLRLRLDQLLQTRRQLLARLRTKDTFRRQNFSVGPEVLRLVSVDNGVLSEDGVGLRILQSLAAIGVDLARHQSQREDKGRETHGSRLPFLSLPRY